MGLSFLFHLLFAFSTFLRSCSFFYFFIKTHGGRCVGVCDEPRLLVWIYDHCIFACLFIVFLPLEVL